MADPNAPWLDDPVVGGASPAPSNQPPTADAPWNADPVVAASTSTAPATNAAPAPLTQDQVNDHILALINDPKVSGQQIRAFYTAQGGKLNEHDSGVLDQRDIYIARNHHAPTVGLDTTHPIASGSPTLTDNRPYSFGEGVRQGDQHVLSNVAGGAGWLANKVGISNAWGDDTREHFANLEAGEETQGSGLGKLTGEVIAASPAALATAPIEGGVAAIGAPLWAARSLAMLADGASQGALTTHANTVGGVVKDAAMGGGLGLGFGTAARGLSAVASTPTRAAVRGREVLDAANRIGVHPLPADVGGSLTKGVNAAGEAGLLSNIPLTAGADRYLDNLRTVRDRVAASFLPSRTAPRDIESAALHVLHAPGGLGDYEARSAEAGGRLYDDAAQLASGTQIETPRTLAAVNALIDQAERTPGNSPGLEALRSLRDDLTPTPDQTVSPSIFDREFGGGAGPTTIPGNRAQYAIDNLRRLRTSFGDNFDSGQRAAREAANTLWGPLSEDIQQGLTAQGRTDAADAYRAADQHWAQRQQNLDEIVAPVLAGRSHELLADKLVDMTRNDSDLLNRGLALMSPDQAAQVRSALVANLGRSKSGAQNATGDAFSLHSFGTDWDKLSDGLKTTMLSGQAGQDLQDLARLAEAAKASGRYKNTSGTARSLDALNLLRGGVSTLVGAGGEAAGGLMTAGATLGAQYGLGHLLASPAVGRGIVRMGEVRPIARTSAGLAALARRVAPAATDQR